MQKEELMRPEYYHIPRIVAESCGPHEAFVYSVIYWFKAMKEGRCKASNSRIAAALPYDSTEKSVANAIMKLSRIGAVSCRYRDGSKRHRIEIVPNVSYGERIDPPTGGTLIHPQVEPDPPTGEQNIKSNNKRYSGSVPAADVSSVIRLWSAVNPLWKEWYANRTQRASTEWLIAEIGLLEARKLVSSIPSICSKPYAPRITTPSELKRGFAKLRQFHYQESSKGGKGGRDSVAFV